MTQPKWCQLCHSRLAVVDHHAVYRSHGGKAEDVVRLCARCHQKAHDEPAKYKKRLLKLLK